MQTWVRFERWILGTLGVFWLAYVSYAFVEGRLKEPIPGLGNPSSITRRAGATKAAYEIRNTNSETLYKLDIQLQIKGYKRPQGTWGGLYMKSRSDYVHVYQGRYQTTPTGQTFIAWDPNTTTITHTTRQANWSSVWRRFQREWTRRQQAQKMQAANR